jgi:hypothetical protein
MEMIKSISREDIDQFLPHRYNIDRFIGSEVEWLSDQVGNIVGTIAEGSTDANWGYAVLRRDESGKYQFWDLETKIRSRDAARMQITRAMQGTPGDNQSRRPPQSA